MKRLALLALFSFPAIAYENCISENTSELEKCSLNNYKSEDKLLNYLYNDIITSFPEFRYEVKKSQQLWIKARDEVCLYNPDDGVEYKINRNACLYQQTNERNRELNAIITREISKKNGANIIPKPKWNEYLKYHCGFMKMQFADTQCNDRNLFLHSE